MSDEVSALMATMGGLVILVTVVLTLVLRHRREVREMQSRERLAAIERNMNIPWEMDLRRPRRALRLHLKSGVVLLGAGLGLAVASTAVHDPEMAPVFMAWGLFFMSIGVVNVVYDVAVGRKEWERTLALDEALTRAYIRRLEGVGSPDRDEHAEADRTDG